MTCIESLDKESTKLDVKRIIAEDVVYACRAFLRHLVNASKSDAFFPQLSNFLENQFLFWLEVSHQTHEASGQLGLLLDKMGNVQQTHHQHAQLAHIVDDARNFMEHFVPHDTYSKIIASIYFSAIPFAPVSSLIANHYRDRFPPALHSIVPHPNNNWDEIPGSALRLPCHSAVTDGKRILILNIESDIRNLTQNFTVQCFDAQSGDALSSISMTSDENEETNENPMVRISWAFSPDENTMVRISLAFSPDAKGRSVEFGHAYRLWKIQTGEEETDKNTMVRISWAVSPDAKFLAVSYHCTCRVWNIETGEQEKGVIMKVPTDDSICSLSLPDSSHVVAGCQSGDIRVWSRTLGEIPTSPFRAHATGPVHSIAHSPRGTHIVSILEPSKGDGTAQIWDISTGVCIFTAPGSWQIAAFSHNGSQIATACKATIRVWDVLDLSSESPCSPMFEGPSEVTSLTYSPDGRYLVSGHDSCILIWDISTGQRMATLIGQSLVDHLAFFPDGKRFISLSSRRGDVCIWDIESLLNGQRSEADSLQWDTHGWILNADGKRLFRPPGMFNRTLPFRHPRNTLVIGSCFPTPSFLPVAYDEEWTKLGESLMYHARKNLQPVSA